jgi:hypothetical protein
MKLEKRAEEATAKQEAAAKADGTGSTRPLVKQIRDLERTIQKLQAKFGPVK